MLILVCSFVAAPGRPQTDPVRPDRPPYSDDHLSPSVQIARKEDLRRRPAKRRREPDHRGASPSASVEGRGEDRMGSLVGRLGGAFAVIVGRRERL